MKVAVLRGGPSSEYEVSLQTGSNVISNLPQEYEAHDIWISRSGDWHYEGTPIQKERASRKFDIFFNALHGDYGEDGQVQKILDGMGVRYTGSGRAPSALSINKKTSKEIFKNAGIKTPRHKILKVSDDLEDEVLEVFRSELLPLTVKPSSGGSSLGVSIARSFRELLEGVKNAFSYSKEVMVEEYIEGREVTCGVLENWRGEDLYAFPPVEIVCRKSPFFDFREKYAGPPLHKCPGRLHSEERDTIVEQARAAHKSLGLRHYSRSDFIIHPRRGVYILETNSLPGLTPKSLYPMSAKAVGLEFRELVGHIVELARS